ncbi:MAG: hypothetical protein K2M47_02635 [Clostridiales bacterium]|nr:hypothetical protein [Clostridiales bacterium]
MVTTKRQIRRDSDRFGGFYNTEIDGIPDISDYSRISDIDPITEPARAGSSMLVSDDVQKDESMYTTPEMLAETETPAPELAHVERPVKNAPPRDKEDLLPTVKTRAYATEKPAQDIEQHKEAVPAKRARASLDTKTKILLCVYVVVALVLAIAVIATGVSISNASAQADAMANKVAQKQAIVLQQEQELALLRDDDAIRGKALQNGMVPAGEPAYSVSNVQTVGYPEATPRTDGWDEFFDAMSKIFN